MRKQIWIPCLLLLIICFILLFWAKQQHQSTSFQEMITNSSNSVLTNKTVATLSITNRQYQIPATRRQISTNIVLVETSPGKTNAIGMWILNDWQGPINFYGRVVDENTNPIQGAKIHFDWNEFPTDDGMRTEDIQSDANGLFSLEKKRGLTLGISVGKDGYYSSKKDNNSFTYGSLGGAKFSPSSLNPVIFHLHKKGPGVDLVTSQYGIRPDFPVLVSRDGNPVNVDLLQRKIDASGDLQISQVKPDSAHWNSATNWSFHMRFSDGGFIETDDAFLFTAPETGYQSSISLTFAKGETNWLTQFSKTYYIVFGQPQKYGWLHVDANMMQQTIVLKYAINPTGSRNLEPK